MNYITMSFGEPFNIIQEPTNHFIDIKNNGIETNLIRSIVNKNKKNILTI